MCPNPQETEDLVTFTEKTLLENFIFYAVIFTVCKKSHIHNFPQNLVYNPSV